MDAWPMGLYSKEPNTNHLFLRMGPPMLAPSRLWSYLGLVVIPAFLYDWSTALKVLLRRYSQISKCRLLVPLFTMVLNWPPEEWPYSARNWFARSVNSATLSFGT